jgi:hypothetical protein
LSARLGRRLARRQSGRLSALTSFVVALSLFVQLMFIPYHQALAAPDPGASDTTQIAAQLKATFGAAATLCVQGDDDGAPAAPAGHAHEDCPFCRFAAEAATLVAPDLPALPAPLDAAGCSLGAAADPGAAPARLLNRNRARAPPQPV